MAREHRRVSARWLTRTLTAARNVLADPTATEAQRHGARRRLNRTVSIARRLRPIPRVGNRVLIRLGLA